AKEVFDKIVDMSWRTGDPGIVFIDQMNDDNPTPHLGDIESTNPCGEQPLLPYEACVLGSLNLSKHIRDSKVDYDSLSRDISCAIRFLDDSIDVNHYPLPEIERMHMGNRKVGLGVMGWADMLVLLGLPYDSPQATRLGSRIMKFIRTKAFEASAVLAHERGAFPNIKGSVFDTPGTPAPRNATVTTIVPTGTISIIADCSSSIEPFFALANRRMALESEMLETNKHFFRMAEERGFYTKSMHESVIFSGSLKGIKGIPADIRALFRTAHEISPEQHVRMQAAFQRHTDNAVSKTINLPHGAGKKDVERAFMLAYSLGCKGVTVFRHGSSKAGTLLIRRQQQKE
ncbi:MAG: adenosylcobalamin-dependent ribonucleoside-diphosphate reductase, partial [Thermodesulfovibrionales bacterium]|nr:adenosylcobalamin-dependent ribonucleoside-diphosphate reductase [Thermodesulfovibrionales bacterium]